MEGRLSKIRKEKALLEQPFIKDTSKTVAEHIKSVVASLGENIQVVPDPVPAAVCPFALHVSAFTYASISWCPFYCTCASQLFLCSCSEVAAGWQVRRFVRYNLGEGIQKKTQNFADEVAQQTGMSS